MPAPASDYLLLFPHQLYREHPALCTDRPVAPLEESLYFTQFRFHQQKLVLHRASMRAYQKLLHEQAIACDYVEASQPTADVRQWIAQAAAAGLRHLHIIDPVDDWLRRRVEAAAMSAGLALTAHYSPNFLNEMEAANTFFNGRKRYFQTDFYVAQRKQRRLLVEPDGQPTGGQWSFDADNRARFPAHETVPALPWPAPRGGRSHHLRGNALWPSLWPGPRLPLLHPHAAAEAWLADFLKRRLAKFGI